MLYPLYTLFNIIVVSAGYKKEYFSRCWNVGFFCAENAPLKVYTLTNIFLNFGVCFILGKTMLHIRVTVA